VTPLTTIEDFLALLPEAAYHGGEPTQLVRKDSVLTVIADGTASRMRLADGRELKTLTPLADIIAQLTPTQAP
jgi:hypothetical protein